MMNKILGYVPNFSKGRDLGKVKEIVSSFHGEEDVKLLDYSTGKDHNRCVVTVVGEPEVVRNVVIEAIDVAAKLIDMIKHEGQRPRMGATDVAPFIPVRSRAVGEAGGIARQVGAVATEKFGVLSFLYGKSAFVPHRENLSKIRRGQFEGMPEKMRDPKWKPDSGLDHIRPTADVTTVGARIPPIAFNINLDTPNLEIAGQIARKVRFIGGSFRFVKAMDVMLEDHNVTQISMNLTDYIRSAVYRVFEIVKTEARRCGVNVVGGKVIGLVPMAALVDCVEYYLQIENFNMEQVLETRL